MVDCRKHKNNARFNCPKCIKLTEIRIKLNRLAKLSQPNEQQLKEYDDLQDEFEKEYYSS
jgi:hypothetical protein